MTQNFVTVRQYIDSIKVAERKNLRQHYGKEMYGMLGMSAKETPLGALKSAIELGKIFEMPTTFVMDKVAGRRITNTAVEDLQKYITECGMKALKAKADDIAEDGQITFLKQVFFVGDNQEIFVIPTVEYLEEHLKDAKPTDIISATMTAKYNPLDKMSDNTPFVDTYSLTE